MILRASVTRVHASSASMCTAVAHRCVIRRCGLHLASPAHQSHHLICTPCLITVQMIAARVPHTTVMHIPAVSATSIKSHTACNDSNAACTRAALPCRASEPPVPAHTVRQCQCPSRSYVSLTHVLDPCIIPSHWRGAIRRWRGGGSPWGPSVCTCWHLPVANPSPS